MMAAVVFGLASFTGALAAGAAAILLAGTVHKRQLTKPGPRPSTGLDMLPTYVSLAVMFFAKDIVSGPLKALAEHKSFAEGLTWLHSATEARHILGGFAADGVFLAMAVGWPVAFIFRAPVEILRTASGRLLIGFQMGLILMVSFVGIAIHTRITGEPLVVSWAMSVLAAVAFLLAAWQHLNWLRTAHTRLVERKARPDPARARRRRFTPLLIWCVLCAAAGVTEFLASRAEIGSQVAGSGVAVGLLVLAAAGDYVRGALLDRAAVVATEPSPQPR